MQNLFGGNWEHGPKARPLAFLGWHLPIVTARADLTGMALGLGDKGTVGTGVCREVILSVDSPRPKVDPGRAQLVVLVATYSRQVSQGSTDRISPCSLDVPYTLILAFQHRGGGDLGPGSLPHS